VPSVEDVERPGIARHRDDQLVVAQLVRGHTYDYPACTPSVTSARSERFS
jgi:hypothetical protein